MTNPASVPSTEPNLWTFEGEALAALRSALGVGDYHEPRRIRIWNDCGDLKVKTDEFTWSPPLVAGEVAP